MKRLDELFNLHRAKSGLFSEYKKGDVAYVGNGGLGDNAVVGFVEARPKDKVFKFPAIVISAFCEATLQTPPFIACGRAGNGLVVLEPKEPMSIRQLAYIAAYINIARDGASTGTAKLRRIASRKYWSPRKSPPASSGTSRPPFDTALSCWNSTLAVAKRFLCSRGGFCAMSLLCAKPPQRLNRPPARSAPSVRACRSWFSEPRFWFDGETGVQPPVVAFCQLPSCRR